jgi:hypothetical protein
VSKFPGAIYSVDGRRRDRRGAVLVPAQVRRYEHRALVSRPQPLMVIGEDLGVEVGRVWALADNADFEAIPRQIVVESIGYIYGGAPILLLGHSANVVRNVREMMLTSILTAERRFRSIASQEAPL